MKDQYQTYLFTTGMFRSGTTLLSRMLNTHSKIVLAADILLEFFKAFRNEVYYRNNVPVENPSRPLENNFKLKHKVIFDQIENGNFELDLQFSKISEITKKIKNFALTSSELYSKNLESLKGSNYLEILFQLLNTIDKTYAKKGSTVLGFKSVWSEQFVPTFLNQFPQKGKALFIIRDPRGVIASNYVKNDHRYPLEFLVRQWRKSVCYAFLYSKILEKYRHRCLMIKYDDLISEPKLTIQKITEFLNLEFEPNLLDPSQFKNGKNELWEQNTSYRQPEGKFNKSSIEKWKNVLSDEIQRYIEYACFPELKLLNFNTNFVNMSTIQEEISYPKDDYNCFAEWIKEFYPQNTIQDRNWQRQIEEDEKIRNSIFYNAIKKGNGELSKPENDNYFIDNRFFHYLIEKLNI